MYVLLLGLPGAGKGTQAQRLQHETGLVHVTTGELFRENIRDETPLGKKAKPFYESGQLVPDELTIGMLLHRISEADCENGCMLDGFPRTIQQAEALDTALTEQDKQIDQAIYIKVTVEELVRRLAGRWSCPNCGAVYNEQSQPPKTSGICDNCSSVLTQRSDDKSDVVRTRIDVQMKNLDPLLDFYRSQGKLAEVNGEREPDEITEDLKRLINERPD